MNIEKTVNHVVGNLIRIGKVSSVNASNCTARVSFDDKDSMISHNLPVMQKNTKENRDYYLPDVDEMVICIFLPNGEQEGYILGSYYGDLDTPPVDSTDKRGINFSDNTSIFYDRENHEMSVNIEGILDCKIKNVHIHVEENKVKVTCDDMSLSINGDLELQIQGNLNVEAKEVNVSTVGDLNASVGGSINMSDSNGSVVVE